MALFQEILLVLLLHIWNTAAHTCPAWRKFGDGPPPSASCTKPSDPLNLPPSAIEKWFTREIFEDLFMKANIGWGPNSCWPYSYDAFVIAARYFPTFGTSSPNGIYTAEQNTRRDVATFFAHAIQETGENDPSLYTMDGLTKQQADDCFYRGGLFEWFEGGPKSRFLNSSSPGYKPADGDRCYDYGRYCAQGAQEQYFYPCKGGDQPVGGLFDGCYFGRGAIQISWNYNYGQFGEWLNSKGIKVDLLAQPNLVMTKMDPPLAIMASLWFYMTPQPPKPAMHDIILGQWNSGTENAQAGYTGPIFGPTSLVINNECGGEDATDPGGPGESRRIKAFKWFCNYFKVPYGPQKLLTCKDMPQKFSEMKYGLSYEIDWSTTWKSEPCNCAPASYAGMIPYYDPNYYPDQFVALNEANRQRCVQAVYADPTMFGIPPATTACLKFPPPKATTTAKKATKANKKGTTKAAPKAPASSFSNGKHSSSSTKCYCKCTECSCTED